MQIQSLFTTR